MLRSSLSSPGKSANKAEPDSATIEAVRGICAPAHTPERQADSRVLPGRRAESAAVHWPDSTPNEPSVEIEAARTIRQRPRDLSINRDRMRLQFLPERRGQSDDVFRPAIRRSVVSKPEVHV